MENEILKEAAAFYDFVEKSTLDRTDPLQVNLGNYYIQTEDEVQSGIRNVEKRLYSGDYRPEQYYKVLSMFCMLKANGFDIDLDRCVAYMKEQLNGSRRLFLRPGGENIAFLALCRCLKDSIYLRNMHKNWKLWKALIPKLR